MVLCNRKSCMPETTTMTTICYHSVNMCVWNLHIAHAYYNSLGEFCAECKNCEAHCTCTKKNVLKLWQEIFSIHQSQSCLLSRPGNGRGSVSAFLADKCLCTALTRAHCMSHWTHSASLTFCQWTHKLTQHIISIIINTEISNSESYVTHRQLQLNNECKHALKVYSGQKNDFAQN